MCTLLHRRVSLRCYSYYVVVLLNVATIYRSTSFPHRGVRLVASFRLLRNGRSVLVRTPSLRLLHNLPGIFTDFITNIFALVRISRNIILERLKFFLEVRPDLSFENFSICRTLTQSPVRAYGTFLLSRFRAPSI